MVFYNYILSNFEKTDKGVVLMNGIEISVIHKYDNTYIVFDNGGKIKITNEIINIMESQKQSKKPHILLLYNFFTSCVDSAIRNNIPMSDIDTIKHRSYILDLVHKMDGHNIPHNLYKKIIL